MILLVSGKAFSGKDEFFNSTVEIYKHTNKVILRKAFADFLKDFCKLIGWDGEKDVAGRNLLQAIGEAARNYNEDVWVEFMLKYINTMKYDILIITDCRYPNEIDLIKKNITNDIVKSIRVIRPNFYGNLTSSQLQHHSETAMDNYENFDYKILNNSTLSDYKRVIEQILTKEGA